MVWRPKSSSPSTTQPIPATKRKNKSNNSSTFVKKQPLEPRWVPKTIQQTHGFYKGNMMLWLPKKDQLGKISNGRTHHVADQTESPRLNAFKTSTIEKEYPSTLTSTQRAYNLQQLLFGKASLGITNLTCEHMYNNDKNILN